MGRQFIPEIHRYIYVDNKSDSGRFIKGASE